MNSEPPNYDDFIVSDKFDEKKAENFNFRAKSNEISDIQFISLIANPIHGDLESLNIKVNICSDFNSSDSNLCEVSKLLSSKNNADCDDDDDDDDDSITISMTVDPSEWLTEDEIGTEEPFAALKTKNEVDEPPQMIPNLKAVNPAQEELLLIGTVVNRIDSEHIVLIKSVISLNTSPVNEGSVLCLNDGSVVGKIQEVFGPLSCPFYVVKWAQTATLSSNISADNNCVTSVIYSLTSGTPVYCIVRLSQFITPHSIVRNRGTDASNIWDEEVPVEEQEFSDDELELEARRSKTLKAKQNGIRIKEDGDFGQYGRPSSTIIGSDHKITNNSWTQPLSVPLGSPLPPAYFMNNFTPTNTSQSIQSSTPSFRPPPPPGPPPAAATLTNSFVYRNEVQDLAPISPQVPLRPNFIQRRIQLSYNESSSCTQLGTISTPPSIVGQPWAGFEGPVTMPQYQVKPIKFTPSFSVLDQFKQDS